MDVRVASRQIVVESGPDDVNVIWLGDNLTTKTVLHRKGLIDHPAQLFGKIEFRLTC